MKNRLKWTVLCLLFSASLAAQGYSEYQSGFKVTFDEKGQKYIRFISWAQVQAVNQSDVGPNQSSTQFNLRRARLLMLTQLNPRFLLVSHFGLNSLTASNMSALGTGEGSQVFLHDMWAEFKLNQNHSMGAGLHYYNGISRLNNQSTLNFLTLDNNRQSWATLGLTDQFARHLGVFAKGRLNRLQYRLALNEAHANSLDTRDAASLQQAAAYNGRAVLGSKEASTIVAGYFDFNFLEQESQALPYKVGSYLGSKNVFNLGYGFFAHNNGSVRYESGTYRGEDVRIHAVDAFLDHKVGPRNAAITAYLTHQFNDYGLNYLFSAYGSGSFTYGHLGYLLPSDQGKTRWQPYLALASHRYDAVSDKRGVQRLGVNAYLAGHHAKLTFEYSNDNFVSSKNTYMIQAMIYL